MTTDPRTWEEAEIALRATLDDDDAVSVLQELQSWGWSEPKLRSEITILREQLKQEALAHDSTRHDLRITMAAADDLIAPLRTEIETMTARESALRSALAAFIDGDGLRVPPASSAFGGPSAS